MTPPTQTTMERKPRGLALISLRVAAFALQLLLLALIGRTQGAAALGAYAVFVAWQGIPGVLASGGLSMGALRAAAEAVGQGRVGGVVRGLLRASIPKRALLAGALTFAAAHGALLLSIQVLPTDIPSIFPLAAAVSAASTVVVAVLGDAMAGAGQSGRAASIRLLLQRSSMVAVLAAAVLADRALSVGDLLALHTLAGLVPVALLLGWALRTASAGPSGPIGFPTGRLWRIETLNMLAAELPTLVLPAFLFAEAAGHAALALRLSQGPALLLSSLAAAYSPFFSRTFSSGHHARLLQLFNESRNWGLAFTIPVLFAAALLPESAYELLGAGMGVIRWPLVILLLGQAVDAATGLASHVLVMIREEGAEWAAQVSGLASLAVLLPTAGASFGTLGYALAVAGGVAVRKLVSWSAWMNWCAYRRHEREARPQGGA